MYKAAQLCLRAANHNHTESMFTLAILGLNEEAGISYEEGINWLEEAVKLGHTEALLYNQAINANDTQSQYEIAIKALEKPLYEDFYSRPTLNKFKALEYLELAADQGHVEAQFQWGLKLYNKLNRTFHEKSIPEKSLKWWKRAAAQGHPDANLWVGYGYYKGEGIKKDFREALRCFEIAAQGGIVEAQYEVGHMYYQGKETYPNYQEAVKWLVRAAGRGHYNSQYELEIMALKGIFEKEDPIDLPKLFYKGTSTEILSRSSEIISTQKLIADSIDDDIKYRLGIEACSNKDLFPQAFHWITLAARSNVEARNWLKQRIVPVQLSPKAEPQESEGFSEKLENLKTKLCRLKNIQDLFDAHMRHIFIENSYLKLLIDQVESHSNSYLILLENFKTPGFFITSAGMVGNTVEQFYYGADESIFLEEMGWHTNNRQPFCLIYKNAIRLLNNKESYQAVTELCKVYSQSIKILENIASEALAEIGLAREIDPLQIALTTIKMIDIGQYNILSLMVIPYYDATNQAEKALILKDILNKLKQTHDQLKLFKFFSKSLRGNIVNLLK